MNYAYNEAKMMVGIDAYRKEQKTNPTPQPRPIAVAVAGEAIAQTAKKMAITPELIASTCREAPVQRAREVVVLVLRKKYGYSLSRIGRILGKHHTSIMHIEKLAKENYEKHPVFQRIVDEVSGSCMAIRRDDMGLPIEAA